MENIINYDSSLRKHDKEQPAQIEEENNYCIFKDHGKSAPQLF